MTDHWQVIEFALRSNLADLTQGDDLYTPEQREIKRAEYDAALAFARGQAAIPLPAPEWSTAPDREE